MATGSGQRPLEITDDGLALLETQAWPGNVRQLRNLIERAQLGSGPLDTAELQGLLGTVATLEERPQPATTAVGMDGDDLPVLGPDGIEPLAETLAQAERGAIVAALAACKGNRRQAAGRLGISRASLYSKLQQHDISR